ncbi:hypothetical protein [Oceanisphaera sp. KMM 10153]|uniref:hypothetical protein n=1 Tax=Oceanisphaera submarina TaxID=3390193 RepID=UPI003975F379
MVKTFTTGLVITGDPSGGVRAFKSVSDAAGRYDRSLRDTNKRTEQFDRQSQQADATLATMTNTARTAAAALSGVFAVGALQGQARLVADAEILSRTLKVSTGTLMEWQYAGEQVNLSAEKMGDIFKDASDKIGDFVATGGGEAKDLFENLNLNINELRSLSPDQQLLKIAEAVNQIKEPSQRIFFMEALADDASRLLPLLENNGALLKQFSAEARNMGVALDDGDIASIVAADQAMKTLSATTQGLANALIADLGPGLNEGVAGLRDWITEAGGAAEVMDNLTTVGGALAALYVGRLAGGIASKTAATLQGMAAERAATAQTAQRIAQEQQAAAQTARRTAGEQTAAVTSARIAVQRAQQAQTEAAERLRLIQLTQQQLAAERLLETQRLQAQISATGRQMSLTRLGEIRRTEATLAAQQAAAERTLAAAQTTATGTTRALTLAQAELSRTNAVVTTTTTAAAAATRTASIAQVAMTTTTRALASGMALLGGPMGVAALAGFALWEYSKRTELARDKTREVTQATDEFRNSLYKLSAAEKRVTYTRLMYEAEELKGKLADLQRVKENLANTDGGDAPARADILREQQRVNDQIADYNAQLDIAQKNRQALTDAHLEGLKLEKDLNLPPLKPDDAAAKKLANQREQAQQYLQELSRLNANEQQQVENWRADSLAQTESYYRQNLIIHEQFLFAKNAIDEEAARRLKEIEEQRWNKYTSGGLGDLAQEQRDAQGLQGPRGELIRGGVAQSIASQTFQGLPEVGGLSPQVGGEFGELVRIQQETERMREAYQQRIDEYKNYRELEVENKALYDEQITELENRRRENELAAEQQINHMKLSIAGSAFGTMADLARTFAGEQSGIYKAMFIAQKGIAIAQTIINAEMAATAALAPPPVGMGPVAGAGYAQVIRGIGYASVAAIAAQTIMGQAHDGIDYVPNEGTWNLAEGERVTGAALNRDLTRFLERENKAGSKGGRVRVEVVQHFHIEGGAASANADPQALAAIYATARRATYEVLNNELRPGGVLNQ